MATIILFSPNVVGQSMAGPAIRCWELANALSQRHRVILVSPNQPDCHSDRFQILVKKEHTWNQILKGADAVITQTLPFPLAYAAKAQGVRLLIDAYDPIPLEWLEQFSHYPLHERNRHNRLALTNLLFQFKMADGILCASEKQRDLWLGLLMGQQCITPELYEKGKNLRHLIDVVPFGLSPTPPQKTGPSLRDKYAITDPIILWGGGIWNWFDPLTLIKAIAHHPHLKLLFMGIKNPDPSIPTMAMAQRAIDLAKELELFNRSVFFNTDWIPYHERQNTLLDAQVGASIHFDHLETRYSFRTRLLDYIWAKLPIVATEGDDFAHLIERHQLGLVVPYQQEKPLANALLRLTQDKPFIEQTKNNLAAIQQQFYWDTLVTPIEQMIGHLQTQPKPSLSATALKNLAHFFTLKAYNKGLKACVAKAKEPIMRQIRRTSSRSSSP